MPVKHDIFERVERLVYRTKEGPCERCALTTLLDRDSYEYAELNFGTAKYMLQHELPLGWGIEKFVLKEHDRGSAYGRLHILISKEACKQTVPTRLLTPVEVYQQNKTADVCVQCGKPTTDQPLFSGVIKYCKSCCG